MAKKLCLKRYYGNDGSLEAFLACKPIPLGKNPGVRLTGIGEVIRRILCWANMTTFRKNILESAGDLQLCAGKRAGCEAAVHACSMFSEDHSDAILLVHTNNAFNRINRNIISTEISTEILCCNLICPTIPTYAINSYNQEARLFISGDEEITSAEGSTQGDPTAMPIYALGSLPLLNITTTDNTKYATYADDISCVEKLRNILTWWNKLNTSWSKNGIYSKGKQIMANCEARKR